MEGERIKKMQNRIVRKNQRSSDGQSCNDPSPFSQPPKDQQSHGLVQDKFICGVCRLSYHNLWAFLRHKLKHITLNAPLIPCHLCETSFKSEKLAVIHYECFHNVRLENGKISPVVGHAGSLSSENVQQTALKSVEETDKNISRSMKRKRKRKAKLSVKQDSKLICHDTLESAQHIGVTCVNKNTSSDGQSQPSETVSERQNVKKNGESWSLNECQNGNSNCFKATANAPQTKALRIEGSPVMRETHVSNTVNVPPQSSNCSSNARKSDLAKKQISLSAASLAKIQKLASIVSARSVSKETARKIFILCKPDKPGMPLLRTKSIARALIKDQVSSKTKNMASTCLSKSYLEGSRDVPPKMQDLSDGNLVDVNKFDRDFLFQLVMRESAGKKLRYMREVYKCLYCETFEKCCLDLLITHMKDFHKREVLDKCPSEMVTSAKVAESAGMVSSEVVSFQEYKTKLFEQKTQDEERKLRLQKEKGLPKHLTGLPCKYCSKRLTTATKLQAHMDRHLNVKRFLCEECGRSFRSWHLLRKHKKDHLNASYGKIKCAFCSFQSGDASAVNNHYRIHPKKLNLCHICGNMYSSLRKHIKVHSLERPYPCPHKGCTYRFTSEIPCKIHYQVHTAHGQRFSCSKCESQFSRKHHLLRHLTKVHRESIDIQETLCSSQISDPLQPSSSGLIATDDVHEFDQSAESTEMEEFSLTVGQDSTHISQSLQ
ncbi:Zinc finger and BTB domain-containing protein 24 [Holothuria leucospilota]|uniref:Zinc finger and BTB domain-containing protein 24 n=1 Tax=Holothuria leucospilota TaxID=206669 RepID=A0A9Q1CAJ2_HOLLE|nr:Zinc finger and BTB domain-containing protein 24 [Holothuria leucospilota]